MLEKRAVHVLCGNNNKTAHNFIISSCFRGVRSGRLFSYVDAVAAAGCVLSVWLALYVNNFDTHTHNRTLAHAIRASRRRASRVTVWVC